MTTPNDQSETPRIFTRCPACGNDTLTINNGHLLCTWVTCLNPCMIDACAQPVLKELIDLRTQLAAAQRERDDAKKEAAARLEQTLGQSRAYEQAIREWKAEVARLTKERDTYAQQVDAQCGFMANIADTLRVRGFTGPKPLDERVIALAQERDALASQVAELQRDRERLDWLADGLAMIVLQDGSEDGNCIFGNLCKPDELRSRIDAAMRAKGES